MVRAQLIPMDFCDFFNITFIAMCVIVHTCVVNTQNPALKCVVLRIINRRTVYIGIVCCIVKMS